MKITKRQLRRIIKEEFEDLTDQYWDVDSPAEVEPVENAWAGGDDLVEPIDHSEAGGSAQVTPEPETLEITETYGASHGPPDANGDGNLSPEELYNHFDLDQDGIVTIDDYAAHVNWHCENPEILSDFAMIKEENAEMAICPDSYKRAGDTLILEPSQAYEMIRPVMEMTDTHCPASAALALADVLKIAQEAANIDI